jgi:hypothetical protein
MFNDSKLNKIVEDHRKNKNAHVYPKWVISHTEVSNLAFPINTKA